MFQLFILVFHFATLLSAQVPTLDSLSDDDLKTIVKEFSTGFVHTSATPPTSLGKVFGAEMAIIVGLNESKGIQEISQRIDPQSEIKYLPHLWLLGGFSVPYGISVELNILPEYKVENLSMKHGSVGLKWSLTDQILKNLPFDLAVRTYVSQSQMSFAQVVVNPSFPGASQVNVSFENTMVGGDTLLGFDFKVVEPYFGVGLVNTKGRLGATASVSTPYSLFDDLTSQQKTSQQSSIRYLLGCAVHLTALNIGIEYTNLFSTHRLSAKLGLQF